MSVVSYMFLKSGSSPDCSPHKAAVKKRVYLVGVHYYMNPGLNGVEISIIPAVRKTQTYILCIVSLLQYLPGINDD